MNLKSASTGKSTITCVWPGAVGVCVCGGGGGGGEGGSPSLHNFPSITAEAWRIDNASKAFPLRSGTRSNDVI